MGAWGHGIYDNDTASDCLSDYADYVKNGLDKQEAINELKDGWYLKDNYSILVIADLQIKHLGKLDDDIKPLVVKVIQEEKEDIDDWRSPNVRKEIIENFENKVKLFL